MKTLWELTRGIAKILDSVMGRMTNLEKDVSSQERRLDELEARHESSTHSMEVKESKRRDQEDVRQDALSDGDYRKEMTEKYGTTNWAKKLINELVLRRR